MFQLGDKVRIVSFSATQAEDNFTPNMARWLNQEGYVICLGSKNGHPYWYGVGPEPTDDIVGADSWWWHQDDLAPVGQVQVEIPGIGKIQLIPKK